MFKIRLKNRKFYKVFKIRKNSFYYITSHYKVLEFAQH